MEIRPEELLNNNIHVNKLIIRTEDGNKISFSNNEIDDFSMFHDRSVKEDNISTFIVILGIKYNSIVYKEIMDIIYYSYLSNLTFDILLSNGMNYSANIETGSVEINFIDDYIYLELRERKYENNYI